VFVPVSDSSWHVYQLNSVSDSSWNVYQLKQILLAVQ
jgi:hypothetical protein